MHMPRMQRSGGYTYMALRPPCQESLSMADQAWSNPFCGGGVYNITAGVECHGLINSATAGGKREVRGTSQRSTCPHPTATPDPLPRWPQGGPIVGGGGGLLGRYGSRGGGADCFSV